jgi:hypothetical protein
MSTLFAWPATSFSSPVKSRSRKVESIWTRSALIRWKDLPNFLDAFCRCGDSAPARVRLLCLGEQGSWLEQLLLLLTAREDGSRTGDVAGKKLKIKAAVLAQQPVHGCVPNSPPGQVAHAKPAKVDPF